MEIVELADIDRQELRAFVDEVPSIWQKKSGVFDRGMMPLLRNFGEKGNLLFGVHVYSMGPGIAVILTEHDSDANRAAMRIHMISLAGLGGPSEYGPGEKKLRAAIEELMDETLIEVRNQYSGDLGSRGKSFKCPNCGATYFASRRTINKEGKTRCQNCDKIVSAIDDKTQEVGTT